MFPPLIACPEVNFKKSDFDENTMLALYWLIARLVFAVIYVSGLSLDNKSEESQGPDKQPLRSFVWAGSIVILIAMTSNLF